MGRRRINKIGFVILGVFVAVFLFTFLAQKFNNSEEADAANMAAFDPGYIISDYQMGNYNSMSESQIQDFLWSKGRCYNTNFSGVGTRVGYFSDSTPPTTWHVINGHTVCLAEENMNGESAAHIIWQAAQDYRINPQVLIVLLQKETGMITDPIPNSWDYQRATGYGCPDTAACSSKYYGFKNQVRNAAWLFRYTLDNGYSKYPVGNVYVQWSPNAACGGSWVNIRNNATSALYRYTPYQPNAAALSSSYGYGDGCSAYGNRNFYSYFEDWFGGVKMEASYVKLDTPRYMELSAETKRINPYTNEVVDILPVGMIRKYDSKIKLSSGEWCLRTEFSTEVKADACIKFSDLKEIEFKYESVPEDEQRMIIKNGSKKIALRYGTTKDVDDFLIRNFVKKTTFLGVVYYITEFDSMNANSEYGIPEDSLIKEQYKSFDSPRKYVLKDTVRRIDPYSKDTYDILSKSRVIEFAAEVTVDGEKYYQTKNNKENNINAALLADDLVLLSDYNYEPFMNPREMIILRRVDRINPYTGDYYDTLYSGRIIKFTSKILINGQWYYRTEHNTKNGINAAVPAWAVGEV